MFGLVDSGADCSILPLEYMEPLGIEISECKKREINTAGGVSNSYTWKDGIRAVVFKRTLTLQAVFTETDVALLGRDDFFHAFQVSFNQRAKTFALKAY